MVGYYTSHMTGIVSSISSYISLGKTMLLVSCAMFLAAFICGSVASAIIVNWARHRQLHGEFAIALFFEAVLLFILGIIAGKLIVSGVLYTDIVIMFLCFIMGLQNAIITKISNAEIRTTHVTGIATDIGIEIGRMIYFGKADQKFALQFHKLKIHTGLLFAFLAGGVTGAFTFRHLGSSAAIILSLLLVLCSSVPIFDDFKRKVV